MDIEFSTSLTTAFFEKFLKSLKVTINRFVSISIFPPKTASLFGVMPHSEILNKIAERAIPFTKTVTIDRANRTNLPVRFSFFLNVSATENNMIAITPIKRKLKTIKKSLSLYGSLPEIKIATKYTTSVIKTKGLNIFAITGEILLTS
jgi:hypothetical protein